MSTGNSGYNTSTMTENTKKPHGNKRIDDDQVINIAFAKEVANSNEYIIEHKTAMTYYLHGFNSVKSNAKRYIASGGISEDGIRVMFSDRKYDCQAVDDYISEMIDKLGVDESGLIKL